MGRRENAQRTEQTTNDRSTHTRSHMAECVRGVLRGVSSRSTSSLHCELRIESPYLEVLVLLSGTEESTGAIVEARHSYTLDAPYLHGKLIGGMKTSLELEDCCMRLLRTCFGTGRMERAFPSAVKGITVSIFMLFTIHIPCQHCQNSDSPQYSTLPLLMEFPIHSRPPWTRTWTATMSEAELPTGHFVAP